MDQQGVGSLLPLALKLRWSVEAPLPGRRAGPSELPPSPFLPPPISGLGTDPPAQSRVRPALVTLLAGLDLRLALDLLRVGLRGGEVSGR